eukprot:5352301-Pleurochrysis_carterae.AAC.6
MGAQRPRAHIQLGLRTARDLLCLLSQPGEVSKVFGDLLAASVKSKATVSASCDRKVGTHRSGERRAIPL